MSGANAINSFLAYVFSSSLCLRLLLTVWRHSTLLVVFGITSGAGVTGMTIAVAV